MRVETKIVDTETDYKKVLYIREKVFIEEQKVPRSLEIDENENDAIYFLLTADSMAAATGRIRELEKNIKFERIATLPEFRGKGLGKALMLYMQSFAKENYKNKEFMMYAQESAISFYVPLGWSTVGKKFIEAGIIHQKMIYS